MAAYEVKSVHVVNRIPKVRVDALHALVRESRILKSEFVREGIEDLYVSVLKGGWSRNRPWWYGTVPQKKVHVSVAIAPSLKRKLDHVCETTGEPQAEVLDEAIHRVCQKYAKPTPQPEVKR